MKNKMELRSQSNRVKDDERAQLTAQMDNILKRQSEFESSARTYPRRIPLVLAKAQGIWVTDLEGNNYIDCLAGAGTLALGHNHPALIKALKKLLDDGHPLLGLDLMTQVKDEFFQSLLMQLPTEMKGRAKIQFCGPTGADGVEAALKLAKIATGRRSIIAFQGAYHGMTHGALSVTGNLAAKSGLSNLMGEVHFFPYPYGYRCPFGIGGEKGVLTGLQYMERVLKDPESGIPLPAAVILEVVQGEGGVICAPVEWLRGIRRITAELGIPLIIDEVQAGIGRTGEMFAFQAADIVPDIFVLSKALGGGLPISVMIYREELDKWESGAHVGTFRGNQMAFAQGIEVLRIIGNDSFLGEVKRKGELFSNLLGQMKEECPCMGEVRGRGLMLGVEIVNPHLSADHLGSFPSHPTLARLLQKKALQRGLIVELGGRHSSVVRFLPPLIIEEEELRTVARIFQESLWDSLKEIGIKF